MLSLFVIAAACVAICCIAYYFPYVLRLFAVRALRRRANERRALVLTYDDGPGATATPQLLSLLRRYNAKATFFILGQNAAQQTDVVRQVVEDGHEIGCHSDRHYNAWKVAPWKAVSDIDAGYNRLSAWIPANGIYRPPFGKITLPTFLAIRRRRAQIGWWTIDSRDSHGPLPTPRDIADRFEAEGGGVVLMHDLDRDQVRTAFVLETTARLLEIASRNSFNVMRLGELLS